MKLKSLLVLPLAAFMTVFAGCGNADSSSTNEGSGSSDSGESANAMVVYFSATGNTEEVARIIADYIDGPIHELEPVDPIHQRI